MKFIVEYPVSSTASNGSWIRPEALARFAQAVEAAGFEAVCFADHPAPSAKWLAAGGHESLDPFAALAFCAAVTSRIKLMTRLVVLPYRNPLATAKSMATVDVLSNGRATFVLGVGYLRSEFAALGVPFDERNDLFDEAVEVLTGLWTSEEFDYVGRHFTAHGQVCLPHPVQRPYPPLWLGGNSSVVLDRVARYGDGWSPLIGGEDLTSSARTRQIGTPEVLTVLIGDLEQRLIAVGRKLADVDIAASSPGADLRMPRSREQRHADLDVLVAAKVTHAVVHIPTNDFEQTLDAIGTFGNEVVRARTTSL